MIKSIARLNPLSAALALTRHGLKHTMGVVMVPIILATRTLLKLIVCYLIKFSVQCNFIFVTDDDDEFSPIQGIPYEEPVPYFYPNAHPDLEYFPRSSLSASLTSSPPDHTPAPSRRPPAPPFAPSVHGAAHNLPQPTQHSMLGIRKSPPPNVFPSPTIIIKKVKNETVGSRGRVRASDFDDLTKVILEGAISEFRTVVICAEEPYPGRVEARDFAADAWVNACRERNIRIEFDEDMLKLASISLYSSVPN